MRNYLLAGMLLAAPGVATCADETNPMSAGDLSCTSYLAIADGSAEKGNLEAWVAGRVAAIVPASFQPALRNVSMTQFHDDLRQFCAMAGSTTNLFEASAVLAFRYQQAHGGRPGSSSREMPQRDPAWACTARRLGAFVSATGIHQSWPTSAQLPDHLANQPGLPFPDEGMVADGYQHSLVIDVPARAAYVVQQGGIAGLRTIYGPLPVAAACAGALPDGSVNGGVASRHPWVKG